MQNNKKYIFLDVDGTLVNFQSKIPPSAVSALKQAQENGCSIMLATGRQKSQIYPWLFKKIDFDGIIACSGAYIEYHGKQIFEACCDPQHLSRIISFFREHGIFYCLQTRDALYTERDDLKKIRDFMTERGNPEDVIESVIGCAKKTDHPERLSNVEKLAYYNSPFDIEEMKLILGDYYEVVSYSLGTPQSGTGRSFHGEINFDGINKAFGIKKFMELIDAPLSQTVAIGDSGNDIEMIRFAATGIAMGNSSADVIAAADLVTTDIDDNGIYNAMKMLGVI